MTANIGFELSNYHDINKFLKDYLKTLSSPFDSYLEDYIIKSKFYRIVMNSKYIGYFAIYDNELLTLFYIKCKYIKYAQEYFNAILEKFNPKSAYVFTGDELYLSCICDIKNKEVKNQAYLFQDHKGSPEKIRYYNSGNLRKAEFEDIDKVKEFSGNFFKDIDEKIKNEELYIFEEDTNILGFGIQEKGKILKGYTSIGVFTREEYRQKGIGRTIIARLKQLCYSQGETPICGCLYSNINIKRTLESSGFVAKTRLLDIGFKNTKEREVVRVYNGTYH